MVYFQSTKLKSEARFLKHPVWENSMCVNFQSLGKKNKEEAILLLILASNNGKRKKEQEKEEEEAHSLTYSG